MLKYTALFATVFCLANSQRPWHAGSSNRLPMVLPQYVDERIAAEQAAQAAQPGQAAEAGQTVQPGQTFQPDQAVQPDQTIQSGLGFQPTIQSNIGFQPTIQPNIGFQPGQTYQPGMAVQPGQTYQPGLAIRPGQEVQGPQGTSAFATASADAGILNRIDGGMSNVNTARPMIVSGATFPTTTINPADLPVDAHGDVDLVNRIKTWPREKQPFWYLNWQAIQAHRGDVNNTAQVAQVQPNPRSFFAG